MGLGDSDLLGEKGAGGGDEGGCGGGGDASPALLVPCSICLDAVKDGEDRSTAKLQCGHQFHLDCIGSAFNAKGSMQCPNCRKIEKGNWLYANGYRPLTEFSIDDWTHDEDLYDLHYSEMERPPQFSAYLSPTSHMEFIGVHLPDWHEFLQHLRKVNLHQLLVSFTELIISSTSSVISTNNSCHADHDLLGHHAVFEHPANASATHSCPYVAYIHPLQPSSSTGSQVPTENVDGTFHHHWNSLSGSIDIPSSHAFPAVDLHYHGWDSHSPPFSQPSNRPNGAEQAPFSSATMRAARLDSDTHTRPGSFVQPFIPGHGLGSRASSSGVSSMVPPFFANSRGLARVQELHASYHQHHNSPGLHGPIFSNVRRAGSMRGLSPIGPATASSEHTGFFLFSPPTVPSRSPQEAEASGGSHFYAWERDRFAPFPLLPVDRDLPWWGPLPQGSGGSDSRAGFWPRHSSERSSSQSRPPHPPRMHPFI